MKIVIFGASGKTGKQSVEKALEQGYKVTAFVRNPDKLQMEHKNLTIVQGDVLDDGSVKSAIAGQDAVLCMLGMPLRNKEGLRAKGTKNIVQAMKEVGVKRLICLTSLGSGDSRLLLPFLYRFLIFPLFMSHLLKDHDLQENYITSSQLDWTIVRPGTFAKKENLSSQHGILSKDTSIKMKISTDEVAGFMVKQLSSDAYLCKAVYLSY